MSRPSRASSLLRRPEAFRLGLVPFLGMLVVPRPLRFLGDLVDDVLVRDLGLAAEAGGGLHVESAIEDVRLLVLLLAERIETLLHPAVAGRAGAYPAAGRSVLGAELHRRLEQIGARLDLALGFELSARIVDGEPGHRLSRPAAPDTPSWRVRTSRRSRTPRRYGPSGRARFRDP